MRRIWTALLALLFIGGCLYATNQGSTPLQDWENFWADSAEGVGDYRSKGVESLTPPPIYRIWFRDVKSCLLKLDAGEEDATYSDIKGFWTFEHLFLEKQYGWTNLLGIQLRGTNTIGIRSNEVGGDREEFIVKHEMVHQICPDCNHGAYPIEKCTPDRPDFSS